MSASRKRMPSIPTRYPSAAERALPTVAVTLAFVLYAAVLIGLEWSGGQERVRRYFTDVEGHIFLYALNTTVSSGLQGITSVLFLVAWHVGRMRGAQPACLRMALGQCLFFALNAADDRFVLHERLPQALEAVYWLGLGGAYVLFLWLHRACLRGRPAAVPLLLLGGALFGAMLVADLLVPLQAPLRLSIEDLCKSAASLALAGFGWHYLKSELVRLQAGAADGELRRRPTASR